MRVFKVGLWVCGSVVMCFLRWVCGSVCLHGEFVGS